MLFFQIGFPRRGRAIGDMRYEIQNSNGEVSTAGLVLNNVSFRAGVLASVGISIVIEAAY